MTDGHVSPCALVVSHEGAIAGLAATVGNLVKATEILGNAMEGMSKTMTEMSRIDREEYEETKSNVQLVSEASKASIQALSAQSKSSIEALSEQMAGKLKEWREILDKVNEAMLQSAECIEALQKDTSHLGWFNTILKFISANPKFEKLLFTFLIFAIVQYLYDHAPAMWHFFLKIVGITGWKVNL